MRLMWLCNIVPPVLAEQLNTETTVKEGWISGMLGRLIEEDTDYELAVCMPVGNIDSVYRKDEVRINDKKITCYRFLEQTECPWIYDMTLRGTAKKIISDFKPDIIHSFGTEYPHSLIWAEIFDKPGRMLVSIQGVMSECANAYTCGLDESVVNAYTFRDLIKKDNIAKQKQKFEIRAGFEKELLKKTGHVAGRTEFDKNAVLKINPDITYHHLGESMRDAFYSGRWNVDKLAGHNVFVSQADYPLKGFHVLLEAMPEVLKHISDVHIYVAGNSITGYETLKEKIKIGSYGRYLRSLTERNDLADKITVLGKLNEEEMKARYLASSVYVCTSSVENSPNSMAEAMLLGTPVIASRCGGIPSMAEEDKEILMFKVGDSRELADKLVRLMSEEKLAGELSEAAVKRAAHNYDREANYRELTEIYSKICQEL
ncbi:MAG: glycosyltransferase family 4 protein [Lachnospiraceae bacterium]|nr:glycosyltransferase family 4 protein [Lachnospiraceae bacterium]